MPRTRPAAVIAADNEHQAVQSRIRRHRGDCGQCSRALRIGRTDLVCESGWDLLKQERTTWQAYNAARTAADTLASGQLALW